MKNGFKNFFIYLFVPTIVFIIINSFIKNNFILTNVLSYLLLLIYFLIKSKNDIKKDFKKFRENFKEMLLIIIKWIIIEFILMMLSNYIIGLFIDTLPTNELENRSTLAFYPYYLLYLLIIAPMLEEYVFRYSFSNIKNYYIYVILTSLLFASLHILSITNIIQIIYIIPYFIIGFGFANIYYKCQNYVASTIGHIIHNVLCVIIILL